MKLTAMLTTLVIGLCSTIALAAPNDHASFRRPDVVDQRRPGAIHLRWTSLAISQVRNNRQVIRVSSRQKLSKLKIEATRGMTMIDKVHITYANGRTQIVEVDARIGMSGRPAMIDLQGRDRQISRIVIVTKGSSRSSFAVLGA
jgi:hypothetical protein